jgi:hydrogenase maturation protease
LPDAIRVAVLGAGNELMADEGVGVHIVRRLAAEGGEPRVAFIEAGTALVQAVDLVEAGSTVLVVDAASGGGEPGSVYRLGLDDVAARRGVSLHEASLPEVFAVARLGGARLGPVVILGIEPAAVEVGTDLSPTMEARLPAILDVVRGEIARLLEEAEHSEHARR